ncbi:MAG: hypothetical protein ACLQU3_28350 [Limisphaerales bacterium]
MTTDIQAPPEAPTADKSRVATIVRWGVRLTSIPVLVLALISLLPTLIHFAVAARDDRINAFGLCGVCLGFLLAWRWPAIGGGISLVSIGVVAAQAEGGLTGDPFSIAFAIQAILFLISSVPNLRSDRPATPTMRWMKGAAIGLLALCAIAGAVIICRGPGPEPIPKEKARYVGVWDSGTGLQIEINKAGEAKVTQAGDSRVAGCNTPVKLGETKVFNATFRGDDFLELASGALGEAKVYRIQQRPHQDGKQMKMTLNASDPYQETNGMALVRRDDTK